MLTGWQLRDDRVPLLWSHRRAQRRAAERSGGLVMPQKPCRNVVEVTLPRVRAATIGSHVYDRSLTVVSR
jgi:hypothetical protein